MGVAYCSSTGKLAYCSSTGKLAYCVPVECPPNVFCLELTFNDLDIEISTDGGSTWNNAPVTFGSPSLTVSAVITSNPVVVPKLYSDPWRGWTEDEAPAVGYIEASGGGGGTATIPLEARAEITCASGVATLFVAMYAPWVDPVYGGGVRRPVVSFGTSVGVTAASLATGVTISNAADASHVGVFPATPPTTFESFLFRVNGGSITVQSVVCDSTHQYVWTTSWNCDTSSWMTVTLRGQDLTAAHDWMIDPTNSCQWIKRTETDTQPSPPATPSEGQIAACCGYDVYCAYFVPDLGIDCSGTLTGDWTTPARCGSSATNDYSDWTLVSGCVWKKTVAHGAAAPSAPASDPDWNDCVCVVMKREVVYTCSGGTWSKSIGSATKHGTGVSAFCRTAPDATWAKGSGCAFTLTQYAVCPSSCGMASEYASLAACEDATFATPPDEPEPYGTSYSVDVAGGSCSPGGGITLSWSTFNVTVSAVAGACCQWQTSPAYVDVPVSVNGGPPSNTPMQVILSADGAGWKIGVSISGGCSATDETLSNLDPIGTYSGGSVVS